MIAAGGSSSNLHGLSKSVSSTSVMVILVCYFVQGAIGMSKLATAFLFKDSFLLNPFEVDAYRGLAALPWIIKPLYGFLTDTVPLLGYKRKSYLVVAGLVGFCSWFALSRSASVTSAVLAEMFAAASVAFSDVVVDSIVVERDREGNDLQTLCWGSRALGDVISAYFSGSLLEVISPRAVVLLTSLLPLCITLSAISLDESLEPSMLSWNDLYKKLLAQGEQLRITIINPKIYYPVLFIFCWQATPSCSSAMLYFKINVLKFKPEFLGRVRLVSSLAHLFGVLIYRNALKQIKLKTLIFWASLISVPLALSEVLLTTHYNRSLGVPDELFTLSDTAVIAVLGQVASMPTLILAASLCPPGVEGTLFAALMSIYNFAGTLSYEFGACLTWVLGVTQDNYANISLLVVLCSLSNLLPLPFIDSIDPGVEKTVVTLEDTEMASSTSLKSL